MILKEILQKIVNEGEKVLLRDSKADWEASALLTSLSEIALKRQAHLQSGLYIADIDERGYLGRVIYKVIQKP
ncbi:MAG: hypothetical protein ABIL68_00080 [bacterium]